MIYLTVEQILFLHARLVAETGGSHGVRELGSLLSTVARPQASLMIKIYIPICLRKRLP